MQASQLLAAADAADRAAAATTPQEEMRAVMGVLAHKEAIQMGLIGARMNRLSQAPRAIERLPLRDGGDDFGRVEARIPVDLFFHLMQQKNFGWDGMASDEGMRDLLKTHPACRVKTVSGKITVGYRGESGNQESGKRKAGVTFGRGTLNLAN